MATDPLDLLYLKVIINNVTDYVGQEHVEDV